MEWYLSALKKYGQFSGRARRKEYWMFFLFNMIVACVVLVIDSVIGTNGILYAIYVLAVFIPGLAVSVRRLHDTDRSGWWFLVVFIPLIGIVFLVFMCQEGAQEENEFGSNPKLEAA